MFEHVSNCLMCKTNILLPNFKTTFDFDEKICFACKLEYHKLTPYQKLKIRIYLSYKRNRG